MASQPFNLEKSQTDLSYAEKLYFQTIQQSSNCQSELIYRLALTLFAEGNPLLLDNKYQHLQKLLESANDFYNQNTSTFIMRLLIKQFQNDPKILKHHILNLYKVEANVRGDTMLKNLLGSDLQNRELQHVGLAYYKKNMLQNEYAEQLASYLEKNFTDHNAWVELGNIYEENLDFEKAIHCYEELLLLKPNDMRVFTKLGQLYFTQGTQSKMEIAKKYFCYVLTNQQDNLRALYGLKNVLEFTVETANEKRNSQNRKLKKLVEKKLKELDSF
jgi:tetratricopeptide (TPR) repeat protein